MPKQASAGVRDQLQNSEALRPDAPPILQVSELRVVFDTMQGCYRAVDGVSFVAQKRTTIGLVGESGSGKTVSALSIMQLLPVPIGRIENGSIRFAGQELVGLPERELRKLRGNKISMIFQEPTTCLNPLHTVGDQVAEVFRIHRGLSKSEAHLEALRLFELVKISAPRQRLREFPHQMSGGMRQRVMIAMALACNPDVLIADEPTTALDVTVQAQILALMEELRTQFQSAIVLITHDLGIVAEMCDEVLVMYAGQIVERARVEELFKRPLHPYTIGLLRSLPSLDTGERGKRLYSIPGTVPDPRRFPSGCRFHPRCEFAEPECAQIMPELTNAAPGHDLRCHLWEKIESKNS